MEAIRTCLAASLNCGDFWFGFPATTIDPGAGAPGAFPTVIPPGRFELPPFPADPDVFGDALSAFGLWVGHEAVFEISSTGDDYAGEQIWALDPSTQEWRRLDVDVAFPRVDSSAVAAGDLLVMWNRGGDTYQGPPSVERSCCAAPLSDGGSVYRVGSVG